MSAERSAARERRVNWGVVKGVWEEEAMGRWRRRRKRVR